MLSEPKIQEILEGNLQRNTRLLAVLREKKVPLDENRNIEFHYWAWNPMTAVKLKQALTQNGAIVTETVSVKEDDEKLWSVTAEIKMTPRLAASSEQTIANVMLAAASDCVYDGWGTHV